MKHRSRIDIQAPIQTVWEWILEPEFIAEWNDKLVQAKRLSAEPIGLNSSYRFDYKMSGNTQSCEGTLSRFKPYTELAWTFKGTQGSKRWSVIESYKLTEKATHIRIVRTLDLSKAPIPWFIRPLVWFILTFGRTVGTSELEKLKALAE